MAQCCSDTVALVRSCISENWNAKTVTISAVACIIIALVYLRKFRKSNKSSPVTVTEELTTIMREYDRRMEDRKLELFSELKPFKDTRGDGRLVILEIGCGGGMNFKYYPDGSEVICVEPNGKFESVAYESVRRHPGVRISAFLVSSAENLRELESECVDVVVSTVVLCSVFDPDLCLKEVIRLLKPGGKFFFMEHAKSQFYAIRFFQVLLDIPFSLLYDGCHPARNTQEHIRKAGFSSVHLTEFEAYELTKPPRFITGIRLVRSHIVGTATK